MILKSLYDLYDRLQGDPSYLLPPVGYSPQKITFKVVLTPSGEPFAIQDAREAVDGRPRSRQLLVPGTTKPSGIGLNPGFLWDNTAYMLGFKPDDGNPQRTTAAFEAFRSRHLAVEGDIDSPSFHAICRFLESWEPEHAEEHSILPELQSGFGVFQIQGRTELVHEDPVVKAWWQQQQATTEGPVGHCLVTGRVAALARIHEKVKGVVGAQGGGAALVGFNDSAYLSYGRTQSFNAPVSQEAAFRYVAAANALLDGPKREKHRLLLGDTTVAFWTEKPSAVEDVFARWAVAGSQAREEIQDEGLRQKLEAFLKALRRGREAYGDVDEEPERTGFYLLGLSPNAARLSVRFFHHGTLAQLLDNLRHHHRDIGIERRYGEGSKRPEPALPSLNHLLDETCPRRNGRPDREKIPPILSGPLLCAVITGGRYPDGLFSAVLRRVHADAEVNYYRASVIKGFLNRNRKENVAMSLDTDRADPPYRLGRLFAALEKTQMDALGRELNATIRDRFYSSASATPRSVFPRLLRTYAHHLAKLERGHKINREKLVQEILDPLSGFPAHLDLTGQGLFAIGYYHQTRAFFQRQDASKPELQSPNEEES
ncbi:MAG TPA: type I-C CRISPR-associated protein Cas8c/Csd1 [Thermoanaerobaculia bacterium]|nr:type I-C CRISPR-associated protein Cas8c/Csd1 [Thermoanaerobaculia bacterium]